MEIILVLLYGVLSLASFFVIALAANRLWVGVVGATILAVIFFKLQDKPFRLIKNLLSKLSVNKKYLSYKKFLETIKWLLDKKYFTKVVLVVIVLLLILLIWINTSSYAKSVWETKINNFTGIGCNRSNVYSLCK